MVPHICPILADVGLYWPTEPPTSANRGQMWGTIASLGYNTVAA